MILQSTIICLCVILIGSNFSSAKFVNSPQTTAASPKLNRTRIIGGIEATRNEYPFIVSLHKNFPGSHFCGGSIIDRSWILTAAHCVSTPDFHLTAGEHDLRISEGTEQSTRAIRVIRHPKYNPATYEDDIALVKVSPAFNYTDFVKPFQLPQSHFVATGNVTTAGWGVTDESSTNVSPVLRKVTVGLYPSLECSKMYGKDFHPIKMICAGKDEGGFDACQGDSGGPLLCDDSRFGDTLCGIVSFGLGCARPDFAGVYTNVAYYEAWVSLEHSKDTNPAALWTSRGPIPTTVMYKPPTTKHPKPPKPPRRSVPRNVGFWLQSNFFSTVIMVVLNKLSF